MIKVDFFLFFWSIQSLTNSKELFHWFSEDRVQNPEPMSVKAGSLDLIWPG